MLCHNCPLETPFTLLLMKIDFASMAFCSNAVLDILIAFLIMKKEISLVTNNLTDIKPYGPDAQPELLLGRGYTGHEHLPRLSQVYLCRVPAHGCGQMFTKSYTHDKNLVASVAYSKDNGYICTEIWITTKCPRKNKCILFLAVFGGFWWFWW